MSVTTDRLSVPVPQKLRTNPKDRRGYPIPYIVWTDNKGAAHFPVNDPWRVKQCVQKKLCGLCGKKLDLASGMWFIGGPNSFNDARGAFIDPPSHVECAHYAIRVCPYLAAPNYNKRLDDKLVPKSDKYVILKEEVMDNRPDLFGLGGCRQYHVVEGTPATSGILMKVYDWISVTWWQNGKPLPQQEQQP